MALLFAGSVAYQALVIVPEMNAAAAALTAERAAESQRLQELNAARKRQASNEATLLLHQENNLRLARELAKTLRGD